MLLLLESLILYRCIGGWGGKGVKNCSKESLTVSQGAIWERDNAQLCTQFLPAKAFEARRNEKP